MTPDEARELAHLRKVLDDTARTLRTMTQTIHDQARLIEALRVANAEKDAAIVSLMQPPPTQHH